MTDRPPLPPFDLESALAKEQAAEDAWNTRDPERVAGAYTADSVWRNRHDRPGQWFRSYGNELWEFDEHGLMRRREASINDVTIDEADRRYFGPRPESERGHEIPLR